MTEIQPRKADDRRSRQRFPLHLTVRYRRTGSKVAADWTTGESLNISSSGVLFTTRVAIPQGESLEAFIIWPVPLDHRIPLKLILKGSIVRSDGDQSAMRFETYEFKTRLAVDPGFEAVNR